MGERPSSSKAALARSVQTRTAGRLAQRVTAETTSSVRPSWKASSSAISASVGSAGAGGRSSSGADRIQVRQPAGGGVISWRLGCVAAAAAGRFDPRGRSAALARLELTSKRREKRGDEDEGMDIVILLAANKRTDCTFSGYPSF